MEGLWANNKDFHKWFYLFLLTTWTAQNLNWLRTPGQRFWKQSCVAHLFVARRTRGMILRGSKIDHYRCPLYFPLWRSGALSRELWILDNSERGKQIGKETLSWDLGQSLSLQFLSFSGVYGFIGWQSLKCTSHPLQHRLSYHHFCGARHSKLVLRI